MVSMWPGGGGGVPPKYLVGVCSLNIVTWNKLQTKIFQNYVRPVPKIYTPFKTSKMNTPAVKCGEYPGMDEKHKQPIKEQ